MGNAMVYWMFRKFCIWHVIVCIIRILHCAQNKHCMSGKRTSFPQALVFIKDHATSLFVRHCKL
jgi:hypothetical protein